MAGRLAGRQAGGARPGHLCRLECVCVCVGGGGGLGEGRFEMFDVKGAEGSVCGTTSVATTQKLRCFWGEARAKILRLLAGAMSGMDLLLVLY